MTGLSVRLDVPEVLRVAKLCPGDRVLLSAVGGCNRFLSNGYVDALRESFPEVMFVVLDADAVQVVAIEEASAVEC
jgi:hypothetical protein